MASVHPCYPLIVLIIGFLNQTVVPTVSHAQIAIDGSLGLKVPLAGPSYVIGHDLGQIRGSNLFHSFGQFNVLNGESATFTGPNTIANILSRVTGGQQSLIDGLLRSTISGANLYLLNPSGVFFGPNASLDVSGSFHVSTADYLRMADGARFHANLSQPTVLSVAQVEAFGFLGPNAAAITFDRSRLQVPEGKAVSVVGGVIQMIAGLLRAPSGRIHVASVASPGEVIPSSLEQPPALRMDSFNRLGKIEVSQGSSIDASGGGEFGTGGPGGTVVIRGGRLIVGQSSILANTLGNAKGAGLALDFRVAEDISLTNSTQIRASSRGAGDGGEVVMETARLNIAGNSGIFTSNSGAGRGGDLTVTARDSIAMSGEFGTGTGLFANAFSTGDGGRVSVSSPILTMDQGFIQAGTIGGSTGNAGGADVRIGKLTLTGGSQIDTSTRGSGRGGLLKVTATDSFSIAGRSREGFAGGLFTASFGEGNAGHLSVNTPVFTMNDGRILASAHGSAGDAGNIDLRAGTVTLKGGAQIDSSTFGPGRAGVLTVVATDSISIAGRGSGFHSGFFSNTHGSGDAGRLFISAPNLSIDDGRIVTNTLGDGNAGNIDVRVGRLSLTGGGQIFSGTGSLEIVDGIPTFRGIDGPGRGGDLTVIASNSISIAGRSQEGFPSAIASTAQFGRGKGGNIFVSTPKLEVRDRAEITSDSHGKSTGDAGNIVLELGSLTVGGSEIISGTEGVGRGGNIEIKATNIELAARASIAAKSTGQGSAGDIRITAGDKFISRNSAVTTEALQSDGGNIELRAGSLVYLNRSEITTSVSAGEGRGGNIAIDPQFVILDRSQIRANAFGGPGGNVRIAADIFLSSGSQITASSELGVPGTVDIQASITDVSGSVAQLPEAVLQAATLLRAACAARLSGGKASSLVLAGRDSLPLEPGGLLPSPLYLESPAAVLNPTTENRGSRIEDGRSAKSEDREWKIEDRGGRRFSILNPPSSTLWGQARLNVGCS